MKQLAPTLAWIDGGFVQNAVVSIDDEGRIENVRVGGRTSGVTPLADTALLPGFVNAHSHAFQIGLRGRGETYPAPGGDFWSWRQAMYDLVDRLDGDSFEALCRRAFSEMLAAGITTVGEFHYLHHVEDLDHEFDLRILRAARAAGIRMVVLLTYYRTGGIEAPLEGSQLRFSTPDMSSFWQHVEALQAECTDRQSIGIAIHSIRGASPEEAAEISQEAARRGHPCHMHLEEQPREIADCRRRYGSGPLALMLERDAVGPHFTGVHLTHSAPEQVQEFTHRGGHACICPLTEGNLGDGIPHLADHDPALCLGTDSNARIDMLEETRWLEYGQRVRVGQRGVLRTGDESAPSLLDISTGGGAAALGVQAGRIEAGALADFCAIDLSHPSLEGWTAETLAPMLVFGCGGEVVRSAWVGGGAVDV